MSNTAIKEVHDDLLKFFQHLRATRDGRPVFALEYVGSNISYDRLLEVTRAAMRGTSLTETVWWGSRFLPLLVVATEVGYTYRGNGTTYWPELGNTLGVKFTNPSRRCLRDFFEHASDKLGFSKPRSSPWVDNFSYIAWPIAHAILPEYMQDRFARALMSLGVKVETLTNGEATDAAFVATLNDSDLTTRFGALVRDSDLSATLARAILGEAEDSWLNEAAINRIKQDLSRSGRAKASVEAARVRQTELKTAVPDAANAKPSDNAQPTLLLIEGNVSRGEHPYLSIRFAASARDVASRIIQDSRTRFYAPSLWSVVPPMRVDALLCGQDVPLRLGNLPAASAPLFPGLDPDHLANNAFRYLQGCSIDLRRPLLFGGSEEQDLELLNQLHPGKRPKRVVIIDDHEEWAPYAKQSLGLLCNHPIYELDLTLPETDQRLTALGLHTEESLRIRVAGTPPLDSPRSTDYCVGDVVALTVEGRFDVLKYDGVELLTEREQSVTIGIKADSSGHAITASRGGGATVTRSLRASSNVAYAPLVAIEWRGEVTTDALLHRTPFGVHVSSSLALTSVSITVSLMWGNLCRVEQCVVPTLPVALTERHVVWDSLVPPPIADELGSAGEVTVEIAVGGLGHAAFCLQKRTAAYWWTKQARRGEWSCEADGGRVECVLSHEKTPLEFGVQSADVDSNGIVLFLPQRTLREFGDGLCDGSAEQPMAAPSPGRPRFVRQLEDTSNGVGLQRLFAGYLNWFLAGATNSAVDFRRRAMTAVLDQWTAMAVCGEAWATEESRLQSVHPLLSDHLAISLCANDYRTLAADIKRSWSDIELWATQMSAAAVASPAFLTTALRDAVNIYEEREGRCSIAAREALGQMDLGQAISIWKAQAEFHSLLATVWPTAGHGRLAALPYAEQNVGIVSDALYRWHQEYRDGHASPRWDKPSIQDAMNIWLHPAAFKVNARWRVLSLLCDDMGMARAIRYAVLRLRSVNS